MLCLFKSLAVSVHAFPCPFLLPYLTVSCQFKQHLSIWQGLILCLRAALYFVFTRLPCVYLLIVNWCAVQVCSLVSEKKQQKFFRVKFTAIYLQLIKPKKIGCSDTQWWHNSITPVWIYTTAVKTLSISRVAFYLNSNISMAIIIYQNIFHHGRCNIQWKCNNYMYHMYCYQPWRVLQTRVSCEACEASQPHLFRLLLMHQMSSQIGSCHSDWQQREYHPTTNTPKGHRQFCSLWLWHQLNSWSPNDDMHLLK